MDRDLPFLGICRGMQLMNVARGGTLAAAPARRATATTTTGARSAPSTTPTTTCAWPRARSPHRAAGETLHATKSHHHQGIDRARRGLRGHRLGGAWTTCPRRSSSATDRFALGVQWHPEADETSRFVAALVEEARPRGRPRDGDARAPAEASGGGARLAAARASPAARARDERLRAADRHVRARARSRRGRRAAHLVQDERGALALGQPPQAGDQRARASSAPAARSCGSAPSVGEHGRRAARDRRSARAGAGRRARGCGRS